MKKKQFISFIKAACRCFAKRKVLVGSKIYDAILNLEKEVKSGFIFIKCDLLDDRVIIFGSNHPLANKAVLVDDVIAFDKYLCEIETPMIAFTSGQDENNITIKTNDGKMTVIQLENDEIKFQQLLN